MEEQKTIAGVEGFEIHDTVLVKIKGNKYRWYDDHEYYGVIMTVGEKKLSLKLPDGEIWNYDINDIEKRKGGDEPELYSTIECVAPQIYREEIQRAVELSHRQLLEQHEQAMNKHKKLLEWQETYENEISFFARLKRFFNQK